MHRISALLDRRPRRWVPLPLVLLLGGCSSYYGQLVAGQTDLLLRREPITAVLADSERDPALRQRLARALAVRDFASAQLALPDNRSYRLYADLGRPFVVWNLYATPEFSIEPLEHCFPIAGCVAYRGYFRQGAARAQAAALRLQGRDTLVAGVEAYSTLGWFADPLLSSMLHRDDERLAALIFHELAHQRLYLPGDTAFNESYASFVEREGLRQWRARRGLPPLPDATGERYRQLVERLLAAREQLRQLYATDLPKVEMRRQKQAVFSQLRRDYRQLREQRWKGDTRFDQWFAQPLNNATLLPFGLYDRWVPAFAALFARHGHDWGAFHAAVARLARQTRDERTQQLEKLMKEQAERPSQ